MPQLTAAMLTIRFANRYETLSGLLAEQLGKGKWVRLNHDCASTTTAV